MEKYDLIELKDDIKKLSLKNIAKQTIGVIIEINDTCLVMFLNNKNMGEYAFAKVDEKHLKFLDKFPQENMGELIEFIKKTDFNKFQSFLATHINEYDLVELLIEKESYTKYGIHKKDRGCVMSSYAIKGYIEVDFSGVDKDGEYYGDCISVKVDDLKVIK